MAGVDAVVHLGGIAVEEAWEKIMPANVAGTYNLFEAARRAGVRRIVVASSNHAVGFFPRSETIDDRVLPRPDGRYGLSKAFAEMLGRLYADKYRMEVFCIRIGAMTLEPEDVRRLAIWIHPEDLVSLVEIGITAPGVKFEIVYGMSDNKRSWWDNSNALRLGYRPKHRSEDYAAAVIAREPPRDPNDPAEIYQGGAFVTAEVRRASEVRDRAGRQQMKIDRLRAFMSRDKDRPRVIVSIDTDDGLTGWGECYNHGPDKALAPILDYLFDFIRGHDPRRIEYLVQLLMQQSRFPPGRARLDGDLGGRPMPVGHFGQGAERAGLSAARRPRARSGEGLCRRLHGARSGGGARRVRPPQRPMRPDGVQAQPVSGRHASASLGRGGARARRSIFVKLRETVRADYEIAFDAHAKIFEVAQALQLGNALAPYDPLFFEEPLRPENFEAWGELKRGLGCTLATGESLYSRFEFLRLLQVRGCDIIQPDVCVVGGLLEMRRIAALAEAHYVTVAPHNPMGPLATAVNVHFAAAQPNFRILEYRLPEGPGYAFGTGAGETAAANAGSARYVGRSVPAEGRLSRTAAGPRRLGRRDGHRAARHRGLRELAAQGADQAGWLDRVGVSPDCNLRPAAARTARAVRCAIAAQCGRVSDWPVPTRSCAERSGTSEPSRGSATPDGKESTTRGASKRYGSE